MVFPTLLLVLAAQPVSGDTTGVAVRVTRFYRPETGQTQVAAFIQSPPVPRGALTLRVAEAAGETLWEQSWTRPADVAGADAIDHLRFTIAPGTYTVDIVVRDSAGTTVDSVRAAVTGYAGSPGVSDLLVAPLIRVARAADTVPGASEFRRGALLITAPGRVRIPVAAPILHYVLEAYTPYGAQGLLAASVRDALGQIVRESPVAPVRIPPDLGVLTGQLDLSGMTQGRYLLVTVLTIGERRFEREAGFEVTSPMTP